MSNTISQPPTYQPKGVPAAIARQLAQLRGRELLLRSVYFGAMWLAAAVGLVLVGCLIDFLIDQFDETPVLVRVGVLLVQVLLALALAIYLLTKVFGPGLSQDAIASWVESKLSDFGHALVTAVQLNRVTAKTAGMSPELITAVTVFAEQKTAQSKFLSLMDHSRLWKGALIALPPLLLVAALYALNPPLMGALLARQALADVEIPHQIQLRVDHPIVYFPTEPRDNDRDRLVKLLVKAEGKVADSLVGTLRIYPERGSSIRYYLEYDSTLGENLMQFRSLIPYLNAGEARYRAWLGDGRLRKPALLRFVPRPVVKDVQAITRLPDYVGKRWSDGADGEVPFEQLQDNGDIATYPDATAVISIKTTESAVVGWLELLRGESAKLSELPEELRQESRPVEQRQPAQASLPAEFEGRLFRINIAPVVTEEDNDRYASGQVELKLPRSAIGYRVWVVDQYGFTNLNPPERKINIEPPPPPRVVSLPFRLPGGGDIDESLLESVPIPVDKQTSLGYYGQASCRVTKVELVYQVRGGKEKGGPEVVKELVPSKQRPDSWDLQRGVYYAKNKYELDEELFRAKVIQPDAQEFGGRFTFYTKGLPPFVFGDREEKRLIPGDEVEFYFRVYDAYPYQDRPAFGRSESRYLRIVTEKDYADWLITTAVDNQAARLKRLEDRQRGIFTTAPAK
jgi:hypothetical protein